MRKPRKARNPQGLRFKRLRQYRRNFARAYPEAFAAAQRKAARVVRVWFLVRAVGLGVLVVAAVGLWWGLVLK